MNKRIDTIIVGGGQGGLSLSYFLNKFGREHIVFDKAERPAHAWRDQRWDSFTLVTPNWSFKLPGAEYDGPDPNGYMTRDEVVSRFDNYVERNCLPVRYGVNVSSVEPGPGGNGFSIRTDGDDWLANRVVIATGLFQQGKVPDFAAKIPGGVRQIASGQYRNPQSLDPGAVLVVGSAQSGSQIAEELNQAGRTVYLCVGSAGHSLRHYRGRDMYEWMLMAGFFDRKIQQLPSPQARNVIAPMLTGKNGGHSLNLHQFSRDGIILLGHMVGVDDDRLQIAPDLHGSIAKSDQFEIENRKMIDSMIQKSGIAAPPPEPLEILRDAYQAKEILSVDLRKVGIQSIIWATGYRFDFSMVKFPVFDNTGFPITRSGATQIDGMYFTGLPWLDSMKTGLLLGAGESAERLIQQIQSETIKMIY